jgi:hypothetical protein
VSVHPECEYKDSQLEYKAPKENKKEEKKYTSQRWRVIEEPIPRNGCRGRRRRSLTMIE